MTITHKGLAKFHKEKTRWRGIKRRSDWTKDLVSKSYLAWDSKYLRESWKWESTLLAIIHNWGEVQEVLTLESKS
jgi:hypothetical protein